jgi:ABC-type Fe3+ transport system permease subunit
MCPRSGRTRDRGAGESVASPPAWRDSIARSSEPLPLIGPAIFAGALFAFTLSLDEFVITLFLIGGGNTLPIYIYTQVKFGITPEVNAIATMLIAASLTLSALAFALPSAVRAIRRRRSRTARHPVTS